MKKERAGYLLVLTLAVLMSTFFMHTAASAITENEELQKTKKMINSMTKEERINVMRKVMERKYNYTSDLRNFDGKLDVDERDVKGSVLKKEPIVLALATDMQIPEGVAVGDKMIAWKDVAVYEKTLLETHDPVNKWFVENLWIGRINRVLGLLEEKAKKDYPKDYKNIDVSVRDVALALGIPCPKDGPPIGPLSGRTLVKDGPFGGRIAPIDSEVVITALDVFMNNMDEWMREFWQDIVVNLDGATGYSK